MKVWLLIQNDHELNLYGIYSSHDKAEKALRKYLANYYNICHDKMSRESKAKSIKKDMKNYNLVEFELDSKAKLI